MADASADAVTAAVVAEARDAIDLVTRKVIGVTLVKSGPKRTKRPPHYQKALKKRMRSPRDRGNALIAEEEDSTTNARTR